MTKREAARQVYRCTQLNIGECDGKGWHRITHHHPTGIRWSEENQPKYATKAEAIAAVLLDSQDYTGGGGLARRAR